MAYLYMCVCFGGSNNHSNVVHIYMYVFLKKIDLSIEMSTIQKDKSIPLILYSNVKRKESV